MSEMKRWALWYAEQGLSIFPVKAGDKQPLVKWGEFQKRRATNEEIETWWDTWPEADIGCVTGAISGRLVLDVDGELGQRRVQLHVLPRSQRTITRRGFQVHFQMVELRDSSTVAGVLPGVDVRGEGGYVKLPPSSFSDGSGRYSWAEAFDVPLAEPPQWLLDLLKKPEVKELPQVNSRIGELLEGVKQGDRHQAFTELAGYYFNCMRPNVAAAHLREWNEKNVPPLEDIEEKIGDFTKRITSGQYDSAYMEKAAHEPKDLELLPVSDLVRRYSGKIDWLVDGLIPKSSSTIFSGWQGRGKTFVATDLVLEVARKRGSGKWMDTYKVARGPVVFVDNEMSPYLTTHRIKDMLGNKAMGVEDLELYYFSRNRLKLTNQKQYAKLKELLGQVKPIMVVVDSFRSCHTLDENSSKDMSHFFDDLVAPLCDEFKTAFFFIDHENKGVPGVQVYSGKRMRGSGAKGDAVDQMFALDERDGVLIFEQSKARYARRIEPFSIEIQNTDKGIRVINSGFVGGVV